VPIIPEVDASHCPKYGQRICGVYAITHAETGRRYVGSSVHIRARWAHHKSTLRKNKHHNPHLQGAWNKYGEDAFFFDVLETVLDHSLLLQCEAKHIAASPPDSFNTSPDPERPFMGRKQSDEHKEYMRRINQGRKHTPEALERMRAAQNSPAAKERKKRPRPEQSRRTVVITQETREKIRAANTGKKRSPEVLEKYRARWTPEERARQSEKQRGRVYTPEQLEGYRERNSKPEYKAKMSAVITAWWAERKRKVAEEAQNAINTSGAPLPHSQLVLPLD